MGTKITAVGKICGNTVTVHCEKVDNEIIVTFNGVDNPIREYQFRDELEQHHPVAGTYYPETDTMLNAFEVLSRWFFDEPPEIKIEGELEEIPGEDDVIY